MDTNELWAAHAAREEEKARFVAEVSSSLESNDVVRLAEDRSDYGYGGWHTSHGDLGEGDLRLLALTLYYQSRGLPVPAYPVLVAEDQHLRTLKPSYPETPESQVAALSGSLRGWGWDAHTSADPDGYERRYGGSSGGTFGQCAVTALLVQQVAGGVLARVEVTETEPYPGHAQQASTVSHYYNVLNDGTEIDLTRDQFTSFEHGKNVTEPQLRDRSYLLGHEGTRSRYRLLAGRVQLPFVESLDV